MARLCSAMRATALLVGALGTVRCASFEAAPGEQASPSEDAASRATDAAADDGPETASPAEAGPIVVPSNATTFSTPSAGEKFVVPAACSSMSVLLWAAGGGAGSGGVVAPGGAGGAAYATFTAEPGEVLNVMIGSPGAPSGAAGTPNGGTGAAPDAVTRGGGGGGLSGIYRFPAAPEDQYIVLAGGGGGGAAVQGGAYAPQVGRAGGGYEGEPSMRPADGRPGTQTQGGAGAGGGTSGTLLTGGDGVGTSNAAPGGGGAGWHGGGGGGVTGGEVGGGGGGSGYLGRAVVTGTLYQATGTHPGLEGHPLRANAGAPGTPGLVILWCRQ